MLSGTRFPVLVGEFPACSHQSVGHSRALSYKVQRVGGEKGSSLSTLSQLQGSGCPLCPFLYSLEFLLCFPSQSLITSASDQVIMLCIKCSLFKLLCVFSFLIGLWFTTLRNFSTTQTEPASLQGKRVWPYQELFASYTGSGEDPCPCRLAGSSRRSMKNEHCLLNFPKFPDSKGRETQDPRHIIRSVVVGNAGLKILLLGVSQQSHWLCLGTEDRDTYVGGDSWISKVDWGFARQAVGSICQAEAAGPADRSLQRHSHSQGIVNHVDGRTITGEPLRRGVALPCTVAIRVWRRVKKWCLQDPVSGGDEFLTQDNTNGNGKIEFKDIAYLFFWEGREKERGRNNLQLPLRDWTRKQPRHVPWPGVEPATFHFAQPTEPHLSGWKIEFKEE